MHCLYSTCDLYVACFVIWMEWKNSGELFNFRLLLYCYTISLPSYFCLLWGHIIIWSVCLPGCVLWKAIGCTSCTWKRGNLQGPLKPKANNGFMPWIHCLFPSTWIRRSGSPFALNNEQIKGEVTLSSQQAWLWLAPNFSSTDKSFGKWYQRNEFVE